MIEQPNSFCRYPLLFEEEESVLFPNTSSLSLNLDIMGKIFSYLPFSDCAKMMGVNRAWHTFIGKSSSMYKNKILADYCYEKAIQSSKDGLSWEIIQFKLNRISEEIKQEKNSECRANLFKSLEEVVHIFCIDEDKEEAGLVEVVKIEAPLNLAQAKLTAEKIKYRDEKAVALVEIIKIEASLDLDQAKLTATSIGRLEKQGEALVEIVKIESS